MVTGSDGAFTFANLPQERYRMRAEKPGFVTREHGQGEALDDIGTSVTLGDGQHLRGIDIVLPKGSVFTVPRGTEHKPYAPAPTAILMFEPTGTLTVGDRHDEIPDHVDSTTGHALG